MKYKKTVKWLCVVSRSVALLLTRMVVKMARLTLKVSRTTSFTTDQIQNTDDDSSDEFTDDNDSDDGEEEKEREV